MAKNAKTKQEIMAEHKAQKAERNAAAAKAQKKNSLSNVLITISVVLMFVLAIALFAYKQVVTSGIIERCTTSVSSENFSVNNSMMTYYFNSSYQSFASQYGSSLSSFGLDTSKSLKSQTSIDGTTTWYDYFLNQAVSQAQQYLILAEAAKAAGVELDEHDMEEIDAVIQDYKDAAKQYGYDANSYVKLIFGTAVKVSDMRDAIELAQLASKYSEELGESYEYTSDDYVTYFEENEADYIKVDYRKYAFTATKDDDGKVDETSAADMKEKANALAATTDEEGFTAYLEEYLMGIEKSEVAEDAEFDEEAAAEEVATAIEGTLVTGSTKSSLTDEELQAWAFSAAAGETYVDASDETGTYTVYMLIAPEYRDEYTTKNGAYIFLSDSTYTDADGSAAKADEIVAEWEAAGKGEEAFLELVEEYSEAGHAHLEENLTKDVAFAEGLYANDVVEGGVKKVYSADDKGTYLVYCAGDGIIAWEAAVDSALRNEDYSADFEEFAAQYWVYSDTDDLTKIIPVSMN